MTGWRPPHAPARVALATALAACALAAPIATTAAVAGEHASLTTIERQVMCVTCKIPLNVAQSPQSDRERAFIQELIDDGENEVQIKRALVAQYGPTVLALPSARGFDLAAYLVPLAVVLALLGLLLALLPRWRAHQRAQSARGGAPAPALDALDAARLESDLSRFD